MKSPLLLLGITYNLHLVSCNSRIATELASSDLPSFLPDGGFIGFGLMHKCHAVCADDDFDEVWALVDSFLRFEGEEIDNGVVGYLTQGGYNTQIVFDSSSPYSFDYYKDAERIFWLKPPTAKNKFETPYSPMGMRLHWITPMGIYVS
ncbi:hypothetical protein M413DRAFT_324509 [Hebeloma cylindrosporum]|uniref:Uncharacterized protein n=1 Tax=Hebeloma cylindrosporum TaxID=76867 RepID=A0A0C3BGM1_HEBCY|nr:hypothetical protein M413DRAFT_324509 [Hebeloma cylindrosporum h7]